MLFFVLSFIFVFLLFKSFKKSNIDSLLYSLVGINLLTYVLMEILSIFNALDYVVLNICWVLIDIIFLIILIYRKDMIKFKELLNFRVSCISILFILFCILMIILSIHTLPYNWDSMTYHMSRVAHWAQNKSINYYSTNIIRQIASPTGHEIINTNIYVLSNKSDLFVNLLQTFSYIFNSIIVYYICRKIGCEKRTSYIGLLLAMSLPIAFAESLTTQVDNFAALFSLIFIYFIIDFLDIKKKLVISNENILKIFVLGLCLGFGYIIKPTVLINCGLFIFVLLIYCFKRKDKIKRVLFSIILSFLGMMLITSPNIYRNYETFHALSNPLVGEKQIIHTDKKRYFVVNFIKNFTYNYITDYIPQMGKQIVQDVYDLSDYLKVDINDESISEAKIPFNAGDNYHHDTAVNSLIVYSLSILIIIFFIRCIIKKIKCIKDIPLYVYINIISILIFFAIARWQIWLTRYEISFLLLLCPCVAILIDKLFTKNNIKIFVYGFISSIAVVSLINQYYYHLNVIKESKVEYNYFISYKSVENEYVELSNYLMDNNYNNLGIIISENDYEYPLFKLTKGIRIEHVFVENETKIYKDENFVPDVIVIKNIMDSCYKYNIGNYNFQKQIGSFSIYSLN